MVGCPPARLLLCVLFSALVGCSSDTSSGPAGTGSGAPNSGKRFIVLMNGNSPFWDAVGTGIRAAADELKVNAVLEQNDGSPQGQLDKLRQFATQLDVAAVGISVTDAENAAIAEQMQKLRDKGIQVVTIDSDVDRELYRDARRAFVGTDNVAAGKALGITAKAYQPDGGKYVTFVGRTGAQNAIDRTAGFQAGAGSKFASLDNMGDQNDRSRSQQNVRDAMANHPGLDVLVGIWSYNAPAIVDVVREKDNRDQFKILVFDAEPQAIAYMDQGDIDAMVVQNPYQMGYEGIRLMKALVEDDQKTVDEILPSGTDIHDTGLKLIAPDQGSPLKAELYDAKTEFMPLSEFRAWLDKYQLEGS